jgi:hypothetical protein
MADPTPSSSRGSPLVIPRGLEILIKKAAVDLQFRAALFENGEKAAAAIDLKLTSGEYAMLRAVPRAQMERIIASTQISEKTRPAFLTYSAAVMLAALGATVVTGCGDDAPVTKGIRPERVEPTAGVKPVQESETKIPLPTGPQSEQSNQTFVTVGCSYRH